VFDQGQPAAIGQRQIDGDQVGAMLRDRFHRFVGVACLGDDVQVGFQLDESLETFANDGVVIY
jgi:hypothetical protein